MPIYNALDTQALFELALNRARERGVALPRVLWVMPRVEAAQAFKVVYRNALGEGACVSPHIQTADRLSQPRAQAPWWALKTQLVAILQGLPQLTHGLAAAQVWALAEEYLQLACRWVWTRASAGQAFEAHLESNRLAGEEGQVVLQLAQVFQDELMALWQPPSVGPNDVDLVVWLDDGELLPGHWCRHFLPNSPVERLVLNPVQGPAPWQALAERWHAGGECPVSLSLAPDETAQAHQAAHMVLNWLKQDSTDTIVIAVLDRLAARRLVDVLDHHGLKVDDRTGWRLSTARVAGWLDQLMTAWVQDGQLLRMPGPFGGADLPMDLPWARTGERTLADWASAWVQLIQKQGADTLLLGDEAGRILLQGLRQMQASPSEQVCSPADFLAAWRHWAEQERFRPEDIESPVRMVPLLSTRLRPLGRVLVLGCAQSHFQESPPGLLPPAVAMELGFPGPRANRIQQISALFELFNSARCVQLVHASQQGGRSEPLLPELMWLDLLRVQSGAEAQRSWRSSHASLIVEATQTEPLPLDLQALPNGRSVPERLRVTALDDWARCPLQFGLKHALPWPRQQQDTSPDFYRLRGIFTHRVLERQAHRVSLSDGDLSNLELWKTTLDESLDEEWGKLSLDEQAVLHPLLQTLRALVPRLAGRVMARYLEGWRVTGTETLVQGELTLSGLKRSLPLSGRVDRLEKRLNDGQVMITDIKFKALGSVKKAAADPLANPQLPAYQVLTGHPHAQLSYLAIHNDDVAWVDIAPPEDPALDGSWGQALMADLDQQLSLFFSGQQNWAAQPGDHCSTCDVRGVCRPDERLIQVASIDDSGVEE